MRNYSPVRFFNPEVWRALCLFLGLNLVSFIAASQVSYIVSDSSTSFVGKRMVAGKFWENSQYISIRFPGGIRRYYPNEIKEYGLDDGKIYLSKNIQTNGVDQLVFLERLVEGELTLYHYNENGFKRFFIEKDSSVCVEISRQPHDSHLSTVQKWEWLADNLRLVRPSRGAYTKLISNYNRGKFRPLQYLKFGAFVSFSSDKLIIPKNLSNEYLSRVSFEPVTSLAVGLVLDAPISFSDYSVNAGVNITGHRFLASSRTSESDLDIAVNTTSVNVPLLLRYTMPARRVKPFFNAGGSFFYTIQRSTSIYEALFREEQVIIDKVEVAPFVPHAMYGYSIGAGCQYKVDFRKTVSLELRFGQYFASSDLLNRNSLALLFGFTL